MKQISPYRGDPKVAKAVFDEVGFLLIQELAKVSKSSLYVWRSEGFPVFFEKYLRVIYPDLKAWKLPLEG